ncbi:MATE family efflux transporter [Parabacteroides sp. 52]|uniref:MATE family efflux transporter n=1 Tax=unclassified Parabacteroides TaxID=2649774 RepID=UPI0013D874F7|nr:MULTISPECIES: MATE family efflux transporter [unclassified Parabacteroides]MDH6533543.1 putative MATE family efflux protein [Parabacteroides sp. PM5-20]NDV54295.1 MATE family efflux transporter [Parabacteroides sp. 52]
MYTNKQIWNVSYPIFLSLLAQNVVNVTDTAFLGRVGEVELGASAMGGLFYICCFTIAFGFSIGSQIVIARRNGERRYTEVGPVMIQGVFFLLAVAAGMFVLSRLFSGNIMRVMISSDVILTATEEFLNWRVFGFFFSFINVMFRALFIGITRTKVLTLNAVVMAITNVILDYLLIFGYGGFPQMGIKGAAIASVVAEAVATLFLFVYTRLTVDIKKYGLDHFGSFDFLLLRRVLGISIYTMLQYFISMSTFFMFFVIVERLGQRELAVANIVRSIYIVMFIPVNSLSTTANSFVSNAIGAGHTDQVLAIIRKIARLSFLIMAACVLIVCLIPEKIISIYTNDPTLVAASVPSLYVISAAMLLSAVSNVFFNGVSGTGNTRSALGMELVVLLFYCVYLYIIGMMFKMPVYICFTTEIIYYFILMIFCVIYLKKATWQNKKI